MLNPPGELIQTIPLNDIQPFKDHPFRVEADEELEQLKKSIQENGVMTPAIVRRLPDGGYQMISGHRRMAACKALGLERMPAIPREMDDDTATMMMVDANMQREKNLPSEKAFAYRMRAEAMQRRTHSTERNTGGEANRITAQIGAQAGESYKTVQRFIRLGGSHEQHPQPRRRDRAHGTDRGVAWLQNETISATRPHWPSGETLMGL